MIEPQTMLCTEEDFLSFEENGYLIIRNMVQPDVVDALKNRVIDLMDGRIRYEGMFFQLESDREKTSYSGPSRDYRKIKDFEYDELFLEFIQHPTFRQIAARYIGPRVSSMRAMVMNKPPLCPSSVPFHQDISDGWEMSAPPVLTIWTALDEASIANGCLQVVPKSHLYGKVGQGHNIDKTSLAEIVSKNGTEHIELKPGQSIVFFNSLIHGSGPNLANSSRIAFTLCLMDAEVVNFKTGRKYPQVYGEGELTVQTVKTLNAIPSHVYDSA